MRTAVHTSLSVAGYNRLALAVLIVLSGIAAGGIAEQHVLLHAKQLQPPKIISHPKKTYNSCRAMRRQHRIVLKTTKYA